MKFVSIKSDDYTPPLNYVFVFKLRKLKLYLVTELFINSQETMTLIKMWTMGSDSGDPGILDTINSKWFYHKFELNICKPLN